MYNVFFKIQILFFFIFQWLIFTAVTSQKICTTSTPTCSASPTGRGCLPSSCSSQATKTFESLWAVVESQSPPSLPFPILPKTLCIRHFASKKNEVTPYYCIFRFFDLSKFASYGRISQSLVHIWKLNLSKSSIEDVLLIGSVLLDVIYFLFQTASTILLRTRKKLFSSVRTKSIPQWGAKVPLSEVKFNQVIKFNPFPLWGHCCKAKPTSRCTEIQWDFLTPHPHPGLLYVCVKSI